MTTKQQELLESFIEVTIKSNDEFLVLMETLTRIGVPNKDNNELFQVCHILHKQKRYYIVHYKQLMQLGHMQVSLTPEDVARTRLIASKVASWGLTSIIPNHTHTASDYSESPFIMIVQHKDKKNWKFTPKYRIGKRT
jgi:Bacteriophage translational regulator